MSGHSHDGSGAVAGEHVIRNIYRDFLLREGVDGVSSGEDTGDAAISYTVALGTRFYPFQIFVHRGLLLRGNHLLHVV